MRLSANPLLSPFWARPGHQGEATRGRRPTQGRGSTEGTPHLGRLRLVSQKNKGMGQ